MRPALFTGRLQHQGKVHSGANRGVVSEALHNPMRVDAEIAARQRNLGFRSAMLKVNCYDCNWLGLTAVTRLIAES
jgi:hypothetical protein